MPRQRRNNATKSTIKTNEDRTDTRDSQKTTSSGTGAFTKSKETDTEQDETSRGSSEEVESTTTAGATIEEVEVKKEKERNFSMCPNCHEKRYELDMRAKKIKCMNCRKIVILV